MSEGFPVESVGKLIKQLIELGSFSGPAAHEMGKKLYKRGGMDAMFRAHAAVEKAFGGSASRSLEATWDGIGDWGG